MGDGIMKNHARKDSVTTVLTELHLDGLGKCTCQICLNCVFLLIISWQKHTKTTLCEVSLAVCSLHIFCFIPIILHFFSPNKQPTKHIFPPKLLMMVPWSSEQKKQKQKTHAGQHLPSIPIHSHPFPSIPIHSHPFHHHCRVSMGLSTFTS